MAGTIQFEFRDVGAARRRDGGITRLLLMGDFSARTHRGLMETETLARRPAVNVDVDTLDAAIGRFAPRLETTLDDGSAVDLDFSCIDDLHPDQLLTAHVPLASLMSLRGRLLDPAQFTAAAAELGHIAGGQGETAEDDEDDRSTVRRLLGDAPRRSGAGSAAANIIAEFVRQSASSESVTPGVEFQQQYLDLVDEQLTAQLREILHLPAFQSLEAAWRGVDMLVSRLDLGEEIELYLLDVTLDELRADAAQVADDPSATALARRLRVLAEEAADADATWAVSAALFECGAADIDLLAAIATATRDAGMSFVVAADSTIAGSLVDASEWHPPEAESLARWQAFRNSAAASAVGMVAPRFLLRLPYGTDTDPIDAFAFEELAASVPNGRELLWGAGALAVILVLARDEAAGAMDIDDLPALTFSEDGERKLQPCTEWLFGERVGDQLMDHGLMPLLGSRHRNAVRLAGWRTVAAR